MKSIEPQVEVYLWLGATDMRAGFDRLSQLVQEKHARSAMSGGLYVFVSRCRKRVKILYWDKDGYALWYKRLEAGSFRMSHRDGAEILTGVNLGELLSGVDLSRIIIRKNAEKGLYYAT